MNDLELLINIDNTPTTEEIFTHIKYIHKLLQSNNIKHWLMYGTLLGCIRNKDIIPYDYDFDFGIMIDDYEKILTLSIDDKDYEIKTTTGTYYSKSSKFKVPETHWRISLGIYYKENKVGDLYIYINCPDGYTRRYSPKEKLLFWPKSTFPTVLIETLSEGYIRDVILPIPNHPVLLLEYFYGPMWTIPIRALSQNGKENHPDYDYYGGYLYPSLSELVKKTKEEYSKENIQLILGKPQLKESDIEYIFPLDQFVWLEENEGIKFKFKIKNHK